MIVIPVSMDLDSMPYSLLSEYNLFTGPISAMTGNSGVLPYDLITPLFTDYAIKKRFVFMPPGSTGIYVSNGDVVDFPVGTILVKNFLYENMLPAMETRILETRLLVRKPSAWEAYVYKWNDAQTDAEFLQIGRKIPISWMEDGVELSTDYLIPTQEECKTCHRYDGDVAPIGPKPQNLNHTYDYGSGEVINQLSKWQNVSYLNQLSNQIMALADWEDPSFNLEARARAYLDVNCAHCHNEKGSASNTSLYYNIEIQDEDLLGFCKTPISSGGNATGGHHYDIVPGHADESILVYRLSSTEAEVAMPELGRTLNHTEGIQLVSEWIDSLPEDARCD